MSNLTGKIPSARQNTANMMTAQAPSQNTIPSDLNAMVEEVQPTVAAFRSESSPQDIMLDSQVLKIGSTTTFRIASTGLGEKMLHKVSGSISLVNTAVGAQAVVFSEIFPFNIIASVNTSINGSTSISNASPYAYLIEMIRRMPAIAFNPLSSRLCSVTAGANFTLTAGSPSLCGYTGGSIAAASTGVINFTFYFRVPYVLNRSTLLGLLPLQNSSTYATVVYTNAPAMLGIDDSSPIYVAGAIPATLSYSAAATNMTAQARYDFWTVPANAALYQEMILNSFQIIEQPANVLATTGVGALKFQFPLNSLLLAAGLVVRNASNALVNTGNAFSNLYLNYNSNLTPFRSDIGILEADQYLQYISDFHLFGTILWDGTATGDIANISDSAGWVDLYSTSNPTLILDVLAAGLTVPATYSFIRTQLVPADINNLPQ